MPQAIIFAFGITSTWAVAAVWGAFFVATAALSSYQKRKAERQARAQFDAAQVDRLTNIRTTLGPRELVLGRVRKGGTIFFASSVGQFKELFIMCVAVAGHEIDGIEQVYFNEKSVDINAEGQVTTAPYGRAQTISADKAFPVGSMSVTLDYDPLPDSIGVMEQPPGGIGGHAVEFTVSGRTVTAKSVLPGWTLSVHYQYSGYFSYARVVTHLGTPGQEADYMLQRQLYGTWTEAHRASGVAYLVCQFAFDDSIFPSGPPTVTVRMRGAKLYDPRSGATVFSENPALMAHHVALHPYFGKRTSLTAAEYARIIAAANVCDEKVSYTGADWVSLYRAAIVVPFGSPARDTFDDLAQAMGGMWADVAGELFFRAGAWQAPVMDLTDADLAVVLRDNSGSVSQRAIEIGVHRPRNEKFNVIAPRIWDQAADYVETSLTPVKADTLIAADGAELMQEVTMPAVFYAMQALHCAGIMLRDARDPMTVRLPVKLRAYPLEVFDTITLTLTRYGFASKEFLILERTLLPEGLIELSLKETNVAIYLRGASFPPQGYGGNTNLPSPWDIHPPVITSISSGTSELVVQKDGTVVNGVRVIWLPVQDASIVQGGTIEVQYRVLPDGDWITNVVPGEATQLLFTGVDDLALILVRARSKSTLAVSDWGIQQMHQVIGKTEPPPDVQNLSIAGSVLSWSLPQRVPDLAGFVFRFHYGQNLDWNSAAPLHNEGLILASPWEPETRPGGVVTIMVKAQDTSGNQSFTAGAVVMNLGDPPIANVVEEWDYKALGWPFAVGEQRGWALVSGDPTANPLDSFYGSDNQAFYAGDTDPFYKSEAYAEMVYVSNDLPINSALAGSIMTLVADVQGTDLRIEYRLAGPGTFYGPDADLFYGPDEESFYGPAGDWMPWPGQIVVANDVYQFRVTIGAGVVRGILKELVVTVDAPDMEELVNDLVVPAGGVLIPHAKPFTVIKNIQIALQVNASSAVTAEHTKTPNLAPRVFVYDAAHTSVGGASVDITLKGY